jgi:hypothetical protein
MKNNLLYISFFFLLPQLSYTQSIDYGREILDTLCAPGMHGRGYYENGDGIAADFLASEFEKLGLKKFEKEYFQNFKIPVNTINGEVSLTVNGIELEPGADYLIGASSPPFSDNVKAIYLTKEEIIDIEKFRKKLPQIFGKVVVIDKTEFADETKENKGQLNEIIGFFKFYDDIKTAALIELTDDNLTYGASQETASRPHIVLKKASVEKTIKSIDLKVESEYIKKYATQNVIGYLEGEIKDSFICISAHYDHIGRMGHDIYFPGANDNASGTAMLLNLARFYAALNGNFKYSIAFFSFGAEEIGLLGSKYYTENPLFPIENIKFLLNLDILGTGDDGIQVVNGSVYKKQFDQLVELNTENDYLKQVKIRGERCNSDHCFFHEMGVESFFIYTLGGIAHYHNIYDKSETLPLTEFEDLLKLLTDFMREI